ncbi:MAG: hypothetical protein ACRCX8_16660 [Sarcina sp.]
MKDKSLINVIAFRNKPEDKHKRLDSPQYNIMNTLYYVMLSIDHMCGEVTIEVSRTESNSFYDILLERQENGKHRLYPDDLTVQTPLSNITKKEFTITDISKLANLTELANDIYDFLKDPNIS